jgi:hypothetical protein
METTLKRINPRNGLPYDEIGRYGSGSVKRPAKEVLHWERHGRYKCLKPQRARCPTCTVRRKAGLAFALVGHPLSF